MKLFTSKNANMGTDKRVRIALRQPYNSTMGKLLENQNKNLNLRGNTDYLLKLSAIGIMLLLFSVLLLISDPLQMIIDSELSVHVGTLLYNIWLKPPLEVFLTVYMFNVTNLDAFTRGIDKKLKVTEVGPYVYQESLENHNVTFNANNTMTYNPRRTVKFLRERSIGDPKVDRIVAPNIPYMGVTTAASSFSGLAAIAVGALTRRLNVKAMLEVSVHDYLWGYEDQLVSLASKFIPSVINFQSFGLMERMFDEGHNVVTMQLPVKEKVAEGMVAANSFSIDKWNGKKGMKIWGYKENSNASSNTACNTLQGTYEGTLFPRNISKGQKFRIYRKAFCRTLPIIYSQPGFIDGIEGYNFKLAENAFDSDINDPDSACFCKNRKCLKKGLGNITPCYYNIPLAISFPHFFNADPTLLEPIEGLKPDEAKHGTEIVIQPQLGIPMRVHSRFQINLLMGDIKYNSEMHRFQNIVIPIFWLDIGIDGLTPGLQLLLKLLFNICPYVQLGLIIALFIGGISLLGSAVLLSCCMSSSWRSLNVTVESSLMTNIAILPLLKKSSKNAKKDCQSSMKKDKKSLLA